MQILYSIADPAGVNIARSLKSIIEKGDSDISEKNLTEVKESLLYSDDLVRKIEDEFILFASKHKSESGKPSFTVHVPGNWGKAEMGGKDKEISFSDPIRMKTIITLLNERNKQMKLDMDTSMEVDHHGPFCMRPCAFVEIGSSEKEWKNDKYAELVAEIINEFEEYMEKIEVKEISLGVGGGHYCPAFNKHEIEGKIAFAHLIPNYAVDSLEYPTFTHAFERSSEEVENVYIDWKGLKQGQRKKIIEFCNEYGVEYKRI
ncbi:MAG: D-aminoacyl-tRNA deacylase [Candidatus Micrarchaeia archaeon]